MRGGCMLVLTSVMAAVSGPLMPKPHSPYEAVSDISKAVLGLQYQQLTTTVDLVTHG